MIQRARIEDLPRMAACAAKFYATSKFLNGFDIEKFTALWTNLLEHGIGVIFVLFDNAGEVRGAIGGMKSGDLYSGEPYSQELFWFVEHEHRGSGLRLYFEFEKWSRDKDCRSIRMVHLADSMAEKLNRVYIRLGFELMESHYGKKL